MPGEPSYFQEFGPGGYHVAMGFANPAIIKSRKASGCAPARPAAATASFYGQVSTTRMSRTPDQRVYGSGTYDSNSYTQCYVSLGYPDSADFDFAKCDADGKFAVHRHSGGQFQDHGVRPVQRPAGRRSVDADCNGSVQARDQRQQPHGNPGHAVAHQPVRASLHCDNAERADPGVAGDGVSQADEPGLPLVPYNIRMRDGSYFGFNNTDLNGYAGFNEVFPILNWLVVDIDTARYKLDRRARRLRRGRPGRRHNRRRYVRASAVHGEHAGDVLPAGGTARAGRALLRGRRLPGAVDTARRIRPAASTRVGRPRRAGRDCSATTASSSSR